MKNSQLYKGSLNTIIMKLLEDKLPLEAVVVMLQKEVAARLGIKSARVAP